MTGALVIGGLSPTRADLPKPDRAAAKSELSQDEEMTFAFEMRDKKWKEVFEYYSEISDHEVVGPTTPTGTFTFIPPKWKQYTVNEIRDIINEALLAKQMLLVWNGHCTILAIDEKDDNGMARLPWPGVKPEELAKLGKYDLVHVVIQPMAMKAEDYRKLDQLMGPFGSVIVLETLNRVILVGMASNLRDVVWTLHEMENRRAEQRLAQQSSARTRNDLRTMQQQRWLTSRRRSGQGRPLHPARQTATWFHLQNPRSFPPLRDSFSIEEPHEASP